MQQKGKILAEICQIQSFALFERNYLQRILINLLKRHFTVMAHTLRAWNNFSFQEAAQKKNYIK